MSSAGEDREHRERLIKLGSAAAFLAIVALVVLIVLGQSESGGGDADEIVGAAAVERELQGIPQNGLVLGRSRAPVTLIEFGDLQCPACRAYAENVIPEVIANQVRSGRTKLRFANFTIIGEESVDAALAALAAADQGRGWNFVELFYRNQGAEATGYVTDEFLTAVAEAAGVPNIESWQRARRGQRLRARLGREFAEAESFGLGGTPSFVVEGPGVEGGRRPIETPKDAAALEAEIEAAR